MKLIDKSALVAEIKELSSAIKIQLDYKKGDAFWIAQKLLLERLKGKIDFLEVKEVDLDKEIEKCLKKHNMLAVGKKDFTDIAKHFYLLGLAQKGE